MIEEYEKSQAPPSNVGELLNSFLLVIRSVPRWVKGFFSLNTVKTQAMNLDIIYFQYWHPAMHMH